MIKLIVATYIFIALPTEVHACEIRRVFCLMDEIAASQNLEAVYGDIFPEINPYGSYGSPYVLNFINSAEETILFLARRPYDLYNHDPSNGNLDLIHHYDYFLIFAARKEKSDSYEVRDVLEGRALMGMSLYYGFYYGETNIDTKEFEYLNGGKKIVGSQIDQRKLSTAVLISGEISTTILFYYDGAWIQHIERDW